jgi:hypothetical protein
MMKIFIQDESESLAAHLQFYPFHGSNLGSIHIWGQWSSYNRTWFTRNLNSNTSSGLSIHTNLM